MQAVIHQFLESHNLFSDRIAVVDSAGTYTYAEFGLMIIAIAEAVKAAGQSNPLVGFITGSSATTYACMPAIHLAGKAFVPLHRSDPIDRIKRIASDAEMQLILSDQSDEQVQVMQEALCDCDIQVLKVTNLKATRSFADFDLPIADDLAYLMYTSGSTGLPKGVPIKHAQLVQLVTSIVEIPEYSFTPKDRIAQMCELTFDWALPGFYVPLAVGASCHIVPREGIVSMNLLNVLDKYKITVAFPVPSAVAFLRRYFEEIKLPELKLCMFAGEALYLDLAREWLSCLADDAILQNAYGPTEATIIVSIYTFDHESAENESVNGILPIGKPMRDVLMPIVDEEGKLLGHDEQGKLCLGGTRVFSAYHKRPEATQAAFIKVEGLEKQLYDSGDIALLRPSGNIVYCGRADSQIKIDGVRVELAEIEHHVRKLAETDLVAIIPENQGKGTILHLFISAFNGETSDLLEALKHEVPAYMLPRQVHEVAQWPLNPAGKTNRGYLKKLIS